MLHTHPQVQPCSLCQPEPTGPRREWGGGSSFHIPRRAAPRPGGAGWGLCRLCNLLPTPGATGASLARYLLVQGGVQWVWLVGVGDAFLLLGQLPACCPTVTQRGGSS